MKKNGYTVAELIIALVVFGAVYFTIMNHVSYAFSYNNSEELQNQFVEMVKKNVTLYASKNNDFFKDGDNKYMTLKDLADLKIINVNENGDVVDPNDKGKNINNVKVKISKKGKDIKVKVLM